MLPADFISRFKPLSQDNLSPIRWTAMLRYDNSRKFPPERLRLRSHRAGAGHHPACNHAVCGHAAWQGHRHCRWQHSRKRWPGMSLERMRKSFTSTQPTG